MFFLSPYLIVIIESSNPIRSIRPLAKTFLDGDSNNLNFKLELPELITIIFLIKLTLVSSTGYTIYNIIYLKRFQVRKTNYLSGFMHGGFPVTKELLGTSLITTLFLSTTTLSPIVTPPPITASSSMTTLFPIVIGRSLTQ